MPQVIVEPGDFVRDQLDDDNLCEVDHIDGTTIFMVDGGVMGLDEIDRVFLPSEVR